MKLWNYMLVPAMTLSLVLPVAVCAADTPDSMEYEAPSFQNAAQAQRAANIAEASFSEAEADEAARAEAEREVNQIAENHADSLFEERVALYADSEVEKIAVAYAEEQGNLAGRGPGDPAYDDAYEKAYQYAVDRANGDFHPNAWDSAYQAGLELARNTPQWEEAKQQALERAYGDFSPNAFDSAYEKAYADYVAGYPGATLEEIHKMRYEQKMGWGQITRYYELHSSYNGLGPKNKLRINEDEIAAPRTRDGMHLDAEIAEATRRNTKTGWNDEPGFNSRGKKDKSSKKQYGLTQTSGVAASDVSVSKTGNKNNKSNNGVSNTSKSNKSNNGSSKSKNDSNKSNNGNSKSKNDNSNGNNGNNGNKGNSANNGNGKNK